MTTQTPMSSSPSSHPHGAGSPATATLGLADTLKTKTQDLHTAAERHSFQQRLLRGGITVEALAAFQHEMLHVQQTLERALRETANRHVRSLARDWHVRSPLTRHDILALGGSIDAAPRTDAARKFCADIDAAAATDPVALVGILYVLEGATNGNVYVGKALEKHLGLEPGRATRSLDPHGDQQRPRWLAFRSGLDALGLDEPQAEAVLAAARRTFQAVYEISDAMPA